MALVKAHLDLSVKFNDCIVRKRKGINMLLQYGPMLLIYLNLLTWKVIPLKLKNLNSRSSIWAPEKASLLSTFFISHSAKTSLTVQISAEELLIKAAKLEGQLSWIFKTASHWNAILLLNKADVFLEQRLLNNLTHNSLVSVFLHKLKYYKKILFLMTNWVSQFDEAILSQIHLMLRYDNLTKAARRQVWRNFLSDNHFFQRCRCHRWGTWRIDYLQVKQSAGKLPHWILAFVWLTFFSDKEYHVCSSSFHN
jgi:hypothetical protein